MPILIVWASLVALVNTAGANELELNWHPQHSGTTVSLRGLSVVNDHVAWASGAEGTVIRTTDAGQTWDHVGIQAAHDLDFRDIQAFSEQTALVLSAGLPAKSYRTTDGGRIWTEVFHDDRAGIFFDAMAFFDDQRGLAFSDPLDGRLVLMQTTNGGQSWQLVDQAACPATTNGEAGFAASGTSLAVIGRQFAWIGLGGKTGKPRQARILKSNDAGKTWSAVTTPLRSGESRGIFSLAFFDQQHGVAVGGDYTQPDDKTDVAAFTTDGGATWQRPTVGPSGYRSAVAVWPVRNAGVCLAVGRNGADVSEDGGNHWQRVSETPYQAIAWAPTGQTAWAVGANGSVARIDVDDPR